jgi:hypothetical protein
VHQGQQRAPRERGGDQQRGVAARACGEQHEAHPIEDREVVEREPRMWTKNTSSGEARKTSR